MESVPTVTCLFLNALSDKTKALLLLFLSLVLVPCAGPDGMLGPPIIPPILTQTPTDPIIVEGASEPTNQKSRESARADLPVRKEFSLHANPNPFPTKLKEGRSVLER